MDNENFSLSESRLPNYGSVTDLIEEFHCHSDEEEKPAADRQAVRTLWISVVICLIFMFCEIVGGYLAQSLAVVADAAHLLTDFASMLVSLFAIYVSSRPASQRMSFGWHRAEVMGAFISVFMIWIITGILVYLAVDRIIRRSYHIEASIMAITAALGILVNFIMAIVLYFGGHNHSHNNHAHLSNFTNSGTDDVPTNINVRAAMVHVIGDMLQSIGVLIAALLIYYNSSWSIADPICTLIFSVIVLCTTIYIVRDAMVVLLEGSPSNINFRSVFDSLECIDGVRKVHNLRIWSLTLDKIAISVHLEVTPRANAQLILKRTTEMLRNRYGVLESTVQIEGYNPHKQDCNRCAPPQ